MDLFNALMFMVIVWLLMFL